jgi:hypothetical protein
MNARALFHDWWQACDEIKGLPAPTATSARDALRDLSDGTIDSRFIGHLEDGLTQLKAVSDLHPTAGQLAEAAGRLRTSVSEIIDANGASA